MEPRPIRDRLAEYIRLARLGTAGPVWRECSEDCREEWRRAADFVVDRLGKDGIHVMQKGK